MRTSSKWMLIVICSVAMLSCLCRERLVKTVEAQEVLSEERGIQ